MKARVRLGLENLGSFYLYSKTMGCSTYSTRLGIVINHNISFVNLMSDAVLTTMIICCLIILAKNNFFAAKLYKLRIILQFDLHDGKKNGKSFFICCKPPPRFLLLKFAHQQKTNIFLLFILRWATEQSNYLKQNLWQAQWPRGLVRCYVEGNQAKIKYFPWLPTKNTFHP